MTEPIKPHIPRSASASASIVGRIVVRILKSRVFWIAAVPILLIYCGAGSCTTYVPPNMVGVKQVVYGSNAGIRKEIYRCGLHLILPSVERLFLFPQDLQVVNFSDSPSEVSQQSRTTPAVKLLTSDGYSVT